MSRGGLYDEDSLRFHAEGKPGKLEIVPTKPMATQRDLSLAYSPGVAAPVRAIAADPSTIYDYTAKGNLVAVISNGTAILGLGDLGAAASKPVMEGKAVLFKRFADVDSIDLEVDTKDVDAFIAAVRYLGPSFGGINLEDIKAPDCFIIEQKLRELMSIPVFHDDQHGTAIICAAGLINALHLTGRTLQTAKIVVNGAGAAAIACLELIKAMGLPTENAILCDTKGVIYRGRTEGMNQWKSAHAVDTAARTLEEALVGADVFLGLSVKGALTGELVRQMADKPIIFAMANPDPEITPEEVAKVRSDAVVATGRSDYPNQVNNVLGFPYIFRGALDVRASTVNDAMKIAAAQALAELAREDVPDEVAIAYSGARPSFGAQYIIPVPFDPRLIYRIPAAVARAAMESGVAQKPIADFAAYERTLRARLDPTASTFEAIYANVRLQNKSVAFADGENESVVRAAVAFVNQGLGRAILIGRADVITPQLPAESANISIYDTNTHPRTDRYIDFLYGRLQRQGMLPGDCRTLVHGDNTVLAACMVSLGDADALVAGVTRSTSATLDQLRRVLRPKAGKRVMGFSLLLARGKTIVVTDTLVTEFPEPAESAAIARQGAEVARHLGIEPRVAFISHSNFGHPDSGRSRRVREAVRMLDETGVDFEYEGDMGADLALNPAARAAYPFCRLKDYANVLVMPAIHSASIGVKMTCELGNAEVIGPIVYGLERSAQIVSLGAGVSEILNMAAIAAYNVNRSL